uniref:Putative secreted protein n=1 Tax=Anopheles darlingi TaxID=43151 RepID=A0A2M4DF27_ANODA
MSHVHHVLFAVFAASTFPLLPSHPSDTIIIIIHFISGLSFCRRSSCANCLGFCRVLKEADDGDGGFVSCSCIL